MNRFLLDRMAEHGRGAVEYVGLNDDGSAAARRFHERVHHPLLTDLAVKWAGLDVSDVYPNRLPDLFSAKPLILTGRYTTPGKGIIRLRGKVAGRSIVRNITVDLPGFSPEHDVLASLWARTKIADLMARDYEGIQQGSPRKDVRKVITQLGLDYRLMTQFTSFVAVKAVEGAAIARSRRAWAEHPYTVATESDVLFTMVGLPQDVRQVYFGADGVVSSARAGTILIDMTTTQPSLSREIAVAASAKDLSAIDAPVSGGDVGAKNAALSIMIGGDKTSVQAVMPLFELLGKKIVHQGGAGTGQKAKLCNQIVIAGTMVGVCESVLYGYKAGLDLNRMLESIRGGAAACWTLDNLAPRILQRNFDPGFFVEHFIKDMGLALEESKRMRLVLPGLTLVHQLYQTVQTLGHGRSGTHALMLALEELAHIHVNASPA